MIKSKQMRKFGKYFILSVLIFTLTVSSVFAGVRDGRVKVHIEPNRPYWVRITELTTNRSNKYKCAAKAIFRYAVPGKRTPLVGKGKNVQERTIYFNTTVLKSSGSPIPDFMVLSLLHLGGARAFCSDYVGKTAFVKAFYDYYALYRDRALVIYNNVRDGVTNFR